jgi:hypothetical protein
MGLGSGIRKNLFRIPDPGPGVKKAPDPGSGSATLLFSYQTLPVMCQGQITAFSPDALFIKQLFKCY